MPFPESYCPQEASPSIIISSGCYIALSVSTSTIALALYFR